MANTDCIVNSFQPHPFARLCRLNRFCLALLLVSWPLSADMLLPTANGAQPGLENVPGNSLLPGDVDGNPWIDVSQLDRQAVDDQRQSQLLKLYRSRLLKKVYANIIYPELAIDNDWEGNVEVLVTVNRSGEMVRFDYSEKSNFEVLNKATIKAIKKSAPFYAVPAELAGEAFDLKLMVKFRLTG